MASLGAWVATVAFLVSVSAESQGSVLDLVSLIQHSVHGEHGNLSSAAASLLELSAGDLPSPALSTFDVNDHVEIMGTGQYQGKWIPCRISAKDPEGHEYTVTVPEVGNIAHVPASLLRKVQPAGEAWVAAYSTGEIAEVQIAKGPYAGRWVQCVILGKGEMPHTYHIHVPTASSTQFIPSVSEAVLRKSREDSDSTAGCDADDRLQALHVFKSKGSGVFADWASRCKNLLLVHGNVDEQKLQQCVRRVLPVSAPCGRCVTSLASQAMSTCASKCRPMVLACTDVANPSEECSSKLAQCLPCAKPGLLGLFQCMGTKDEQTSNKLDELHKAAHHGMLAQPGAMDMVLGAVVESLMRTAGALREQ